MPTPSRPSTRFSGLLIFLIALTVRFSFLYASPDRRWPHAAFFEGDAPLYADWARALREGRPFEFDLPIHSPGMAFLLLPFAASTHPDRFLIAKIFMGLLGAATCALLCVLARDRLPPRVAILAGLLAAASFPLALQNATLNNETPYTFLLILITILTIKCVNNDSRRAALLLGLLHGLAALLRADHVLLWLLGTAWSLLPPRRPPTVNASARLSCVALSALAFFLTALPWNLRGYFAIQRFNTVVPQPINYDALGIPWTDDARATVNALPAFARDANVRRLSALAVRRKLPRVTRDIVHDWLAREIGYLPEPLSPFVFISHQGALSFALANNPFADGGFSTRLLDVVMDLPPPDGHVSQFDFAFANPRHLRLFQHGYAIGLQFLADHPADALRLMGRKLARFADGLAGGFLLSNLPHGPGGTRWPVDQITPETPKKWLWNTACIILILLVAWRCPHRELRALAAIILLSKGLLTLAFYGYARQAVAIQPFTLLFIAVALDRFLIEPIVRRRPVLREALRPLAALLVLAVVVSTLLAARRAWCYDIAGRADDAPQYGSGAFLSHQPIQARRLSHADD